MAGETKTMVVRCGNCRTTVLAEVIGKVSETGNDDFDFWYEAVLLKCPACNEAVFATRPMDTFEYPKPHMDWGSLKRVWPNPDGGDLDLSIPFRVRKSLDEAQKCVGAQSYLAAAVMVRRTLEAVANHFGVTSGSLPSRLGALRDKGVIDVRMLEWADSLRKHGNLGAHDTEGNVTEQDAKDLVEFAEAICDYVFVLSKKFEDFLARQEKDGATASPVPDATEATAAVPEDGEDD
jgi:hypothetical protein